MDTWISLCVSMSVRIHAGRGGWGKSGPLSLLFEYLLTVKCVEANDWLLLQSAEVVMSGIQNFPEKCIRLLSSKTFFERESWTKFLNDLYLKKSVYPAKFSNDPFITAQTAFHHCTFQFITAHFVHHALHVKTSPAELEKT